MVGSSGQPDAVFETLVQTYIKRELNLLHDVTVAPADAPGDSYFTVKTVGWEIKTGPGVKTGIIALSCATVHGDLEVLVNHNLYTGTRSGLAEICTAIVGTIDNDLDKLR